MVRENPSPNQLPASALTFFSEYRLASILSKSRITKKAEVPALRLFQFLFALVFFGRDLSWNLEKERNAGFKKDTVYRVHP